MGEPLRASRRGITCSSSMRRSSRGTPGREEEARAADVEREAAGGADRVVDDLRRGGQHRLLAVVRRHDAAALGEEVLHLRQPLFVQHELHAGGLCRDLLRQIIDGRAETAIDDDRIGALRGKAERIQQALAVVADGGAPVHRQPDVLELLAHVAEVGIDDLAGEDFVSRADDLDAHGVSCDRRGGILHCHCEERTDAALSVECGAGPRLPRRCAPRNDSL